MLYINEDFDEEIMEVRKELLKQAKELKKKEKNLKVIHSRIISFDTRQNPSQFDAGNEEQEVSQIFLIKLLLILAIFILKV